MVESRLQSKLKLVLAMMAVLIAPFVSTQAKETGRDDQEAVQDSRKQDIAELIAVLRDKSVRDQDPKHLKDVIRKLGALKAAEACDDLAALLAFRWTEHPDFSTGSHEGDGYWAKEALFEIGKPALPALVKAIESHGSDTIDSKNAVETVMLIHRDNRAEGPVLLRQAARKAQSPLATQRLNTAAAYIEAINAKLSSPPKSQEL
jgi:hypothetical protein